MITRRDVIPTDGTLTHFSKHLYIIVVLVVLESHHHPNFVIFDAGSKLTYWQLLAKKLLMIYPAKMIQVLYNTWIREPPQCAQEDVTYNAPDDDNEENNDISKMC